MALTETAFSLPIVTLLEYWFFSEPPLLIINVPLMPLFSEPRGLCYHPHHHYHFWQKSLSNPISSYHGNFPLDHPIWIKAWRGRATCRRFPQAPLISRCWGEKETTNTSGWAGLSPQNRVSCGAHGTSIPSFDKYLFCFYGLPGTVLGTGE